MRKKQLFITIIICLLFPNIVLAEEKLKDNDGSFVKYDEIKKIIQEIMKSYYIKENYIQYHNSRRANFSPEDATSQDPQFTVCSGYVYNVYNEALKMNTLPTITDNLFDAARNYYNLHKNDTIKNDHFLIYYEDTLNNIKYAYNNKTKFSDFVELIQPGDIFLFSGHAMIAYDVITNENGKKDVLLLNSNGTSGIASRLYSTRSLSYSYDPSRLKNNIIDVDTEGGIQYKWLSNYDSRFVTSTIYGNDYIEETESTPGHAASKFNCMKKQLIYYTFDSENNKYEAHGPRCNGTNKNIGTKDTTYVTCDNLEMFQNGVSIGKCSDLSDIVFESELDCQMDECTVIRPFYEGPEHDAIFNYSVDSNQYQKSKLRTEYPGLYIEKTVNKNDNNSVYFDDELTYSIKVTNKSKATYNEFTYPSFTIEEDLSDYVDYIESNGIYNNESKLLKWEIDKLNSGESIVLSYKVKVKNDVFNVNKEIISSGKFYNDNKDVYITTGTVKNKIIAKSFNTTNTYSQCYNSKKDNYNGLSLIDEIYKCSSNNDLKLNNFSFTELFDKKASEKDQIYFKKTLNDDYVKYQKMILNNYWGGITVYPKNENYYFAPLKWIGNSQSRKYSFNDADFEDGDILIYLIDYEEGIANPFNNSLSLITPINDRHTNEKGIYAFIYIDGKFVGKNGSEVTARDEFTYNYYSDIETHLYSNINNLGDREEELLKYINYETLLDKDYYIILRPSQLTDFKFELNNYKRKDSILYNIDEGLSLGDITVNNDNTTLSLYDNNDNQVNNKSFATGGTLKVKFGVNDFEYILSVKGDTLGTGIVNIDSAKKIAKHIIDGNIITEDEYLLAADYNDDGNVRINDLVALIKDIS